MQRSVMLATLLAIVIGVCVGAQEKGGEDETGAYDVVPNWLKPFPNNEGWTYGLMQGVFAESPDRIFVLQGGELPVAAPPVGRGGRGPGAAAGGTGAGRAVAQAQPGPAGATPARSNADHRPVHFAFVLNRNGEPVDAWTQWDKLFVRAHKVTISPYDPDKHVWILDDYGQQIFKFTNDGRRLVMTLGEREVAGTDEKHFGRPTDIAFLPDGTFFVSDGYTNSRVMKFDKSGTFLTQWGTKGTGPGQFNLVHCVAVDAMNRVYVVDRSNSRIQVFDDKGTFLDEWPNIRSPTHIHITQDQFAWVSDSVNMRVMKYDLKGRLVTTFGVSGSFPGAINNPHHFSTDSEGNLYVPDFQNHRVQKFTPKPGADRNRIIGPRFAAQAPR